MIRQSQTTRRGVLLLVVLSMLTLFLMLGVTYLVAASRARKVAKAYALAAGSSLNAAGVGPQLLDEAFLTVVRGTTVTSGSIQPGNDLLGDRYGKNSPEKGVLSGNVSGTTILSCTVTGLSNAKSLAGRVLTFTLPGIPGASTRIIRATENNGVITIYFPAGRTISGVTLSAATINSAKASPQAGPTHLLVNNRDFDNSADNEPYDAFDAENTFLAQVTGTSTTPSYSVSGTSVTIDNDGDGTLDSGWLDLGLPPLVDASGFILQPKAAVLVVDLDGRINLNTHGSNIDLATTEATTDFAGGGGDSKNLYPNELVYSGTVVSGTIQLPKLPRGMGLGAAEVSLAATDVTGTSGAKGLPHVLAGLPSMSQSDTTSESRPRPIIGQPEGRYGDTPMAASDTPLLSLAKPGLPSTDDNREIDRWVSSGPEAVDLGAAALPPDSSTTLTLATVRRPTSRAACGCGSMHSDSRCTSSPPGVMTRRSRSMVARRTTTKRRTIPMRSTLARRARRMDGSTIPNHSPMGKATNATRLSRQRNWKAFCGFMTPTRCDSSEDSSRFSEAALQTADSR
jgi:hypothetical protein